MSLFVLICPDKPDALPRRLEARPAHLAYVASFGARVRLAGPMLGADGATPAGSLFILDMDTVEDARAFNAGDPYVAADVFGTVSLHPFRAVAGDLAQGLPH